MYRHYHAGHAPHVSFDFVPLPPFTGGGVCVHSQPPLVMVDPEVVLGERDRVAVHELVHARRGPAPRGGRFDYLRAREERAVDDEVAEVLVPTSRLARFCDRMAELGEGVGPTEVMTEFDVTRRVAEDALDNLKRHERGKR